MPQVVVNTVIYRRKVRKQPFILTISFPVASGGETVVENLALAYVSCSLRKGARETGFDSETKQEVRLFDPLLDNWEEHFVWVGAKLIGLTAKGRATIVELDLNRNLILAIREEEILLGRHPF